MIGPSGAWRISLVVVVSLASCSSAHRSSATNGAQPTVSPSGPTSTTARASPRLSDPPTSEGSTLATGGTVSTTAAQGSGAVSAPSATTPNATGTSGGPVAKASTTVPNAPVTLVEIADSPGGRIIVDGSGHPLYVDDNDSTGGVPTCVGSCTSTWAPLIVPAGSRPFGGTALTELGTVMRPDGTKQATLKGRPLYRYLRDPPSGTVTGDGVAGVWRVAMPPPR